jgi:hypothetical protein
MSTKPAAPGWRKSKAALAIVIAIIATPFVLIMLLASINEGRR